MYSPNIYYSNVGLNLAYKIKAENKLKAPQMFRIATGFHKGLKQIFGLKTITVIIRSYLYLHLCWNIQIHELCDILILSFMTNKLKKNHFKY